MSSKWALINYQLKQILGIILFILQTTVLKGNNEAIVFKMIKIETNDHMVLISLKVFITDIVFTSPSQNVICPEDIHYESHGYRFDEKEIEDVRISHKSIFITIEIFAE